MSKEVEFLNFIFKNAEMGIIGIDDVLNVLEDADFADMLNRQKQEYENILKKAKEILKCYGKDTKENSGLSKVRSNIMVKMGSMMDSSVSNFAKMMMEGTNKGIIEIQEKINNFNVEDEEIIELAKKLLATEERNLEDFKSLL